MNHTSPHHSEWTGKVNGQPMEFYGAVEEQDASGEPGEPGEPGDPPRTAFSMDLPLPWFTRTPPRRSRADLVVSVVRAALWLIMAVLIAWLLGGVA